MAYAWLDLDTVNALVPLAKRRGVSAVARGESKSSQTREGFVPAYRRSGGSPRAMAGRMATANTTWAERRDGFIARHLAQGGPWWEDGEPTRRHLALIMWAYSPTRAKLRDWMAR